MREAHAAYLTHKHRDRPVPVRQTVLSGACLLRSRRKLLCWLPSLLPGPGDASGLRLPGLEYSVTVTSAWLPASTATACAPAQAQGQ